jgi:multiple sugar transport system substrate-binding protein
MDPRANRQGLSSEARASASISRRAILRGLVAVGAAGIGSVIVAACGQQAAAPTPQVVEKVVTQVVEKPVEKVVTQVVEKQVTQIVEVTPTPSHLVRGTLVFWGHDNHPIDNAVPGFKERYPDVTFDSQHIGDWLTKFKTTLASGQGVPDLVWLEATDIQNFGAQGVLLDVTDLVKPIKNKFAPGKLTEVFIVKKQQYVAIPSDLALVGLWYRDDIMQKAGIKQLPKNLSFDDFVKMVVTVQKATGAAGFLLPKNGWAWPFEIILAQLGGSITSADGTQVTVDDDKGVAAMTAVKKLWDTKANLDTDWLQAPYWGAIKAGKLASDYMPAWMRGFVRGETKSPSEGLGQWRVAPLPDMPGGESHTAQIGGASLASTKFTKNPDGVKAFMEYAFATIDGTVAVGSWGIIPSYIPYLESSIFQNQTDPIFGDFTFGKVWAQLANDLSPKYARTAVFSEADTLITQNMMPMLRGEVSIKEGMKSLGDKIREANQRYQY